MHPFDLYSIGEDRWVWKPYVPSSISIRLVYVLNRMTQRSLQRRYQTAAQVLQDLNAPSKLRQARRANSSPSSSAVRNPFSSKSRRLSQKPSSLDPSNRLNQASHPASAAPSSTQQSWNCITTITDRTDNIIKIAVSPDGYALVGGSTNGTIRLWDLTTGTFAHTLARYWFGWGSGHRDRISDFVFRADGYLLFSSSEDGQIKSWDMAEWKLAGTLPTQGWLVTAIGLSADRPLLVSGGSDGNLQLWNLDTYTAAGRIRLHRDRVTGVAISPDGSRLISGSADGTIRIWSLLERRPLHLLTAHGCAITSLTVSPDWQTLVTGSVDGSVRIWDIPTGTLRHTLAQHREAITALALSADGQLLATGSSDNQVLLWHPDMAELLAVLPHAWGVYSLSFAPDGHVLVSNGRDATLKVWQRQRRDQEQGRKPRARRGTCTVAMPRAGWRRDGSAAPAARRPDPGSEPHRCRPDGDSGGGICTEPVRVHGGVPLTLRGAAAGWYTPERERRRSATRACFSLSVRPSRSSMSSSARVAVVSMVPRSISMPISESRSAFRIEWMVCLRRASPHAALGQEREEAVLELREARLLDGEVPRPLSLRIGVPPPYSAPARITL